MSVINIKDFLIDEESTIIEAMELLNKVAKKVLFIEKQGRLIAAITDGDIRRWILKKGSLDAKVKDVANYNPKFLSEKDKVASNKYMKKYSIEAVPIVDENMHIVSIVLWNDKEINNINKLRIPVVMMAGGLGTRLYPYTKILPKPLIPIGEIPISEHIINRFYKYGCRNFFLILNHKKNMIKAYYNEIEKFYNITYVDEDKPLGTGGGLSLLKGKINTTFILTNCDILIQEDYDKIYQYHRKKQNFITIVSSLKNIRIPYGVIDIGEDGEMSTMKEKPNLSFFTNTGCYIVEPKVIEDIVEGETISFPDIIDNYKRLGKKIGIYPISENAWMDMGQFDEMKEMREKMSDAWN